MHPEVHAFVAFAGPGQWSQMRGVSRPLDLWVALSPPEFAHCVIFLKAPRVDAFVEVQVWHSGLTVDMFTADFVRDNIVLSAYTHAFEIRHRHNLRPWRPRLGITCVSVVKHALGIDAPLVFTPRQLYRYLCAQPWSTRLK